VTWVDRTTLVRTAWTVLVCATVARSAVAQTRPEPRLLVSFYGGVARHGSLWEIPKQPGLCRRWTWRKESDRYLGHNRPISP